MREIKFRAWDKNKKRMIKEVWSLVLGELAGGHDSEPEEIMGDDGMRTNNYILQQYTGIKDKNGKDIYEGDIVKFKIIFTSGTDEVVFNEGRFELKNISIGGEKRSVDNIANYCEVVGNIFENPELLTN